MKIKIFRSKFLEGLKAVQNIVPAKAASQILQNVLLVAQDNTLVMTTTEIELSVCCTIDCEVIEAGSTTLPVKFLFNSILKAAEGEITIDVDSNERANIFAGSAKFTLAGISSDKFPKLPTDDDSFTYSVSGSILREMLRKTSYAASQDDTRRNLKSVLMSLKDMKLTVVATDGRRLALVDNEVEFPESAAVDIVLPIKAVQELQRSLSNYDENVSIKVQSSQISFNIGNIILYSKLIVDKYPNYTQVIPQEDGEQVIIDRQLLINAVERASVMTLDESHSVKLVFEGNRLTIMSATSDFGEAKDEIPVKYAGEKIEIMFNPSYLMDPLKAIEDDEVSVYLSSGFSPAVIKCSLPFLYVLMPLRIN
jgi:DNA polymerase-3 subunit beta